MLLLFLYSLGVFDINFLLLIALFEYLCFMANLSCVWSQHYKNFQDDVLLKLEDLISKYPQCFVLFFANCIMNCLDASPRLISLTKSLEIIILDNPSCILLAFLTFLVSFGHFLFHRFRISLFARWKQRGMFAMCMWVVQLLLILSNMDSVFIYVPEYYLEALVNRQL